MSVCAFLQVSESSLDQVQWRVLMSCKDADLDHVKGSSRVGVTAHFCLHACARWSAELAWAYSVARLEEDSHDEEDRQLFERLVTCAEPQIEVVDSGLLVQLAQVCIMLLRHTDTCQCLDLVDGLMQVFCDPCRDSMMQVFCDSCQWLHTGFGCFA